MKCDISRKELEADCLELAEVFEGRTKSEDNHFTHKDVLDALQSFEDKNVKLNEADNVLKQNAELKKQNELLKQDKFNAEQEAMTEVSSVKREYARKEQLLADERAEAQRRTKEAESLKQSIKADTQKQAQAMIKAKVKSLETSYQAKTSSHYAYVTGVSLYAVLVTLFTAIWLS